MKNLGKRRRLSVTVRRLIPLTLIAVLVVGLSAGAAFLRPVPAVPTASETAQALLSAQARQLAGQATALSRSGAPAFATLSDILGRQAAALAVPGAPTASASPSPTRAPEAAALLDETVRSVHDLLDRAIVEPSPGLARLYTSAALGRLEALRPLWTGRDGTALSAQSLTPAPDVPQNDCVLAPAGTPSAIATSAAPAPSMEASGTTTPAATMSDTAADATRALLRAAGQATYLYQVALPRQDTAGQSRSSAALTSVGNITRDGLSWLASACRPDGLAEPGYVLPPSFLSEPGPGLGAAEVRLAEAGLDLVASSGAPERGWALRVVLDSAARAAGWNATLSGTAALPGLPDP